MLGFLPGFQKMTRPSVSAFHFANETISPISKLRIIAVTIIVDCGK